MEKALIGNFRGDFPVINVILSRPFSRYTGHYGHLSHLPNIAIVMAKIQLSIAIS